MTQVHRIRRRVESLERQMAEARRPENRVPTYQELIDALISNVFDQRHLDALFRILEPHLRANLIAQGGRVRRLRKQGVESHRTECRAVGMATQLVSYPVDEKAVPPAFLGCDCAGPDNCFGATGPSPCWVRTNLMKKTLGPAGGLDLRRHLDMVLAGEEAFDYDVSTITEEIHLLCDPLNDFFDPPLILDRDWDSTPEHRNRRRREREAADQPPTADTDGH